MSWELEAGLIGGQGARDLVNPSADYQGATFEASAKAPVGAAQARLLATDDIRSKPSPGGDQKEDGQVREAFLAGKTDRWEWAVGRQRILWGRADGVNPTDVWTPRQFDRAVLTEAAQYRGADTMRLSYVLDDARQFSAFIGPHFRPAQYGAGLFADFASLPLIDSTAVAAARPAAALRYESMGTGADYAITAARTAEFTPYLRPGAGPEIEKRYGRLTMIGADTALTQDRWVYRTEAAWLSRERDADGLAPASTLSIITAAERELSDNWLINVQLIGDRQSGTRPSVEGSSAALGEFNRLLFHQQRAQDAAVSIGPTFRPDDQRGQVSLLFVQYTAGERFWRLRGERPIADRAKIGLLFERYEGPAGSTFAFLARNNVLWLTLSAAISSH